MCIQRVAPQHDLSTTRLEDPNAKRFGISEWAIGVTTAPRAHETIEECLESVERAGWSRLRIFAEPRSHVPHGDAFSLTQRDERLGAFPNWYLALAELIMRQPHADAYFMIQDDAILAEGLRAYLESNLWPAKRVGVVSVYCPSHYSEGGRHGFFPVNKGWSSWGALAYVFPNRSARHLLGDSVVINHRHHGNAEGIRNIDSVVGSWCRRIRLRYFIHEPSLVQHIGSTSTIWQHKAEDSARGRRCAKDFIISIENQLQAQ